MNRPETEIAQDVVRYLDSFGWEVFQEVQPYGYGRCCDIVARRGKIIWTVECKTKMGLSVIDQAWGWGHYANLTSIATPDLRRTKGIVYQVLSMTGVGWLEVSFDGSVREAQRPALRRTRSESLASCLCEDHKTFAMAGNNRGDRLTPYSRTCRDIAWRVKQKPGITIKELLTSEKYHYATPASARGAIAKWAVGGHIDGVIAKRNGKSLELYPA